LNVSFSEEICVIYSLMAHIHYSSQEIILKIVYYGPSLSGKTTNLRYLFSKISPERKGKLLSLDTEADRTLFFDFMSVNLGKVGRVGEFGVRFQLYTVPGQVRYNVTRRLVLKGADALVFVADSQEALRDQNVESYRNMLENLRANNRDPVDIPIVLQYNKRDLDQMMSVEEMDKTINISGPPNIEAEAINGRGVNDAFKLVTSALAKHLAAKHSIELTTQSPLRNEMELWGAEPQLAAASPPPSSNEPPEKVDEPEMPAPSGVVDASDIDAILNRPRKVLSKELPSLDYIYESDSKETLTEKRSYILSEVPLVGIESGAESVRQAIEGITWELRSIRQIEEEILDLLRKIKITLRSGPSR
jgi:signal recognition particle receptor subunit beta